MATYDFQIAKEVLAESKKDRILCVYLNRRPDGTVSGRVLPIEESQLLTPIDRLGQSLRRLWKRFHG